MRAVRSLQVGIENGVVIGERHVFQPVLACTSLSNAAQPPSLHWKLNCQRERALEQSVERRLGSSGATRRNAISTIAVSSVSG